MKKRILIVDDEVDFAYLLKVTLESEAGYEVRAIIHSPMAMAAAREFRPDLVLIDCMMPGVRGEQLAATLQSDPDLCEVRFAFLTATLAERNDSAGESFSGVQTYLPKLMPVRQLLEFIAEKTSPRETVPVPAG